MSHSTPPQRSGMSTGAMFGLGCLGILMLGGLGFAGCMAVVATGVDDELDEVTEAGGADNGDEDDNGEEPEEDDNIISNGTHLIGDDIPAGTYHTDGPDEDGIVPSCYWARLSGTSGEFDDIIANDNVEGSSVVTIEESDVAIELSGGCDWELEE